MPDLDEQLERIAIQVEHLPDAEAQAIFDAERKRLKAQMALITRLETKMAEIQDQRNSKTVSTREKAK